MKRPIFFPQAWLCLLWICLIHNAALAQNGITVYSDTVSALEDAVDDSTYSTPPATYSHTFSLMEEFGHEEILDLLSGFFGIGGVLLIILAFITFLIPVFLVLLAVYLIFRSHRENNRRIEQAAYDPGSRTIDEDAKNRMLKQSAVKNACWGIAIIVIECIIDFTDLLHVVGIAMLCMAASDWLTTLIRKKKE